MADTYRRKVGIVEARRMPTSSDIEAVKSIAEWLQPGIVEAKYGLDADEWDSFPLDPVEDFDASWLQLDSVTGWETADLGDWLVKENGKVLVVDHSVFQDMFEAV